MFALASARSNRCRLSRCKTVEHRGRIRAAMASTHWQVGGATFSRGKIAWCRAWVACQPCALCRAAWKESGAKGFDIFLSEGIRGVFYPRDVLLFPPVQQQQQQQIKTGPPRQPKLTDRGLHTCAEAHDHRPDGRWETRQSTLRSTKYVFAHRILRALYFYLKLVVVNSFQD